MPKDAQKPMNIPAVFKLALIIVTALTVLSLAVTLTISFMNVDAQGMADMPEHQQRIFDTCSFCWQSGFGAIVGLIGGKLAG